MNDEPEIPINHKVAFALLIEEASEQFRLLVDLIEGGLDVRSHGSANEFDKRRREIRAPATIQMALAKAFLFNVARAYRIMEHGAGHLAVPTEDRKCFIEEMRPIVVVRDVNEHAYDPGKSGRGESSRPKLHAHEQLDIRLDETSVIILGPQQIMMGPLNLVDVFDTVEHIRGIAGFHTIDPMELDLR